MDQQNNDKNQKTELTDRLVLLSDLAYKLEKYDEQENQRKEKKGYLIDEGMRRFKYKKDYAVHLQNIEIQNLNPNMFLAVDDKRKHCYFVARGTDFSNKMDILNDLQIIESNIPYERLQEFIMFFDTNYSRYENYNYYTTGHSLGGSLAEYLTLVRNQITACESFNAGASLAQNFSKYVEINFEYKSLHINNPNAKKIIAHHIIGDPISTLPVTKESNREPRDLGYKFNFNAHGLDNFLFFIDVASTTDLNLDQQEKVADFYKYFVDEKCNTCRIILTKQEYYFCKQFQKIEYLCEKHHTGKCIKCEKLTLDKQFIEVEIHPSRYMHVECKICFICFQIVDTKQKYFIVKNQIKHSECPNLQQNTAQIKLKK